MNDITGINRRAALLTGVAAGLGAVLPSLPRAAQAASKLKLLNVSYDPTRELYAEYDASFAAAWKAKTGDDLAVSVSNGGSGSQARAVISGLEADIVTLALGYDIDAIAKSGLLSADWAKRLPNGSTPYTSTIVFLTRKGNPKGLKDWPDLLKSGVQIVVANPKTSGGARWAFLAAYGWALGAFGGSTQKANDYIRALYKQVPVLDAGSRGATLTFTNRGIGDVLISWEDEAHMAVAKGGAYEIITPAKSILAEPPVAVVDANVDRHKTRAVAEAYLQNLYTPQSQDLLAKYFYRPRDPQALAKYAAQFPKVDLFTIETFGGWQAAQKQFFANGGVFDQIYGG
ncbi:sulfate ABC transporter substrate-binding protein [Acidisoma cellulosilytica]|uniref:Sulfate ABC transporter substrate-binding protein n=1 Tax=Acidisoma cellulosilyticum TaxID=2802395 RepID=A0A963Z6D0_9PROT|nr:sulfate ABC transporter substrate-binding protein [Acidisoma cellulosilyticum]MCB8883386.1 sulfate ABC transporter substrate-binding protein [Acidisoma cellulosilyticum]